MSDASAHTLSLFVADEIDSSNTGALMKPFVVVYMPVLAAQSIHEVRGDKFPSANCGFMSTTLSLGAATLARERHLIGTEIFKILS